MVSFSEGDAERAYRRPHERQWQTDRDNLVPAWRLPLSDHIHILGICGTFMGGLALLARENGYTVTGSDRNIYPPMSTQLQGSGVPLTDGYDAAQLASVTGQIIVGNALTRGQPVIEAMLNAGLPYTSGPEWLGRHVLQDRWVLAVAGTHGKTSTASMLAWILEHAGLQPGFLIGGVPNNFGLSARLGSGQHFVVEADEYDSAFFDKRSKFVHYRPKTVIMSNLEYDHADIFPDLQSIETQFHHLVRCVPGEGRIIRGQGAAIDRVMARGCWTPVEQVQAADGVVGHSWCWRVLPPNANKLEIASPEGEVALLEWSLIGEHNAANATAAIAAAAHVGVPMFEAVSALQCFKGVRRRLELLGEPGGTKVYDDFAHHPTAIKRTLSAVKESVSQGKLIAIIEPRSNTMRLGEHAEQLANCAEAADHALWCATTELTWDLSSAVSHSSRQEVLPNVEATVDRAVALAEAGDTIVVMTNGSFDGLHDRLLDALSERSQA